MFSNTMSLDKLDVHAYNCLIVLLFSNNYETYLGLLDNKIVLRTKRDMNLE